MPPLNAFYAIGQCSVSNKIFCIKRDVKSPKDVPCSCSKVVVHISFGKQRSSCRSQPCAKSGIARDKSTAAASTRALTYHSCNSISAKTTLHHAGDRHKINGKLSFQAI